MESHPDSGWIKLHRQLLTNGWLKNHKVLTFWIYCLLKAVHKPTKAIIGFQEIHLLPGQFIFGRKKASKETRLSERQIRTCCEFMKKAENLTIKTTNKFSIITVVNWHIYQSGQVENDQQSDQQATNNRPHTRSIKNVKKYNPSEISTLVDKLFPSPEGKELFNEVRQAISSTRKTGKVSDSIILAELQKWEKYPISQVEAGISKYLSNGYHSEGKKEAYLLAIIRNQKIEQKTLQVKSTGSRLLDDYYKKQGATQ
jgi:hypothetical protein